MRLAAALLTGISLALAIGAATGRLPTLRFRLARSSVPGAAAVWLRQAGSDLTPGQFLTASVVAGSISFALLVALTGAPAVAIVPALAVALLPRAYYARRRTVRMREVQESWPDGIRELLASIAAGASLHRAVLDLEAHGPAPLREAFTRYPAMARVLGTPAALELVKENLADPTSDRIIEVLVLAHERGSHLLPEILHDLADATTKDVRALEEIATEALEQRINARAVFVLPWLVLLVLTLQPGHFRDFYRSAGGVLVVVIGGLLSLTGMWLVARLDRDPVERRVFGFDREPGGGR